MIKGFRAENAPTQDSVDFLIFSPSMLKVFLEQHIGLRVCYPEIPRFYRDVQTGRLTEPLEMDAVAGIEKVIRENTPKMFDPSVARVLSGEVVAVPPHPIEVTEPAPLAGC